LLTIIFIIYIPSLGSNLSIGAILCILSFALVVCISHRPFQVQRGVAKNKKFNGRTTKLYNLEKHLESLGGSKEVSGDSDAEKLLRIEIDRLKHLTVEEEENPSIMIGITGIYGIINGIGISDALINYFGTLGTEINARFMNTPFYLPMIFAVELPYTLRLIGFLATFLPFIHGAILSLTTQWYYDPITKKYHFGIAFAFLIGIFVHSALFLFLGTHLIDISFFILILWIIMSSNTIWLIIQAIATHLKLERTDIFLQEWIILNFNTAAFLSVFVFTFQNLFSDNDILSKNEFLNVVIIAVLLARSLADYIVGWREIYNKRPTSTNSWEKSSANNHLLL
jgi:hypothetical protein